MICFGNFELHEAGRGKRLISLLSGLSAQPLARGTVGRPLSSISFPRRLLVLIYWLGAQWSVYE